MLRELRLRFTIALHFLFFTGNTVIIKPSEIAHEYATMLAEIVPQYLDNVSSKMPSWISY